MARRRQQHLQADNYQAQMRTIPVPRKRSEDTTYLLFVVVPGTFGIVAEDKVQYKSCVKDIKAAAVPVSMMGQIVL